MSSGGGVFAAQNMMYRHSVTLYDETGKLLAKIKDKVNLADYGYEEYKSKDYLGGPVEAVFSKSGKYLWVSQYSMIGKEFKNPGCDACAGKSYDPSFVYKINTVTKKVENVIEVGAVPKFMAISSDESKILVSNWSSSDVSIIDTKEEKEVRRVDVGVHPRGIAIKSDGSEAFVTIMGSTKIARINLANFETSYIESVGRSPRHLVLSADDRFLFCSVNSSNTVVRIDLEGGERLSCATNSGPRTMVLSKDQRFLYVVNYFADTFSKIQTDSMIVKEVVNTSKHPIGICGNWETGELWVACYSGSIEVFRDFELRRAADDHLLAFNGGLKEWFGSVDSDSLTDYSSDSKNVLTESFDEVIEVDQELNSQRLGSMEQLRHVQQSTGEVALDQQEVAMLLPESREIKNRTLVEAYESTEEFQQLKVEAFKKREEAVERLAENRKREGVDHSVETKADYAPIRKIDFEAIQKKQEEIRRLEEEKKKDEELLALEKKKGSSVSNSSSEGVSASPKAARTAETVPGGQRNSSSGAKSRVELMGKSSHKKKNDKFNPFGCTYHVIVGSFSEPANAIAFREEMEAKGYPAQILKGSSLTYVSAQCYTSTANAKKGIKDILEETGIEGWVLKK